MDDSNQMGYGTFEYVFNQLNRDIMSMPMDSAARKNSLPFALFGLINYVETSLRDESIKAEIVSKFSVVEKHFKEEDGIHLLPLVRKTAHKLVFLYKERLTEFGVDQQEQLIKAFNAVQNHVVRAQRHSKK